MSRYSSGHEDHDPYIDYASHSESHREGRVYGSHVQDIQHGAAQGLNPLHELGAHQPHQQPQHPQQHHQVLIDPHGTAHHQSPTYDGGQGMLPYGARHLQQPTGTKRQRNELEGMGIGGLPEAQMQSGQMQADEIQSMSSQMRQPAMVGYGGQPLQQAYHGHTLPNQGHRSKMPRMGDQSESIILSQGGAPSVVGMEGMPEPALRPRGPKLKFSPEDDQLLVDLKENKSLTWKQIAEFFPGRSSGTLQVRYCTKLKAKTTQWTDETVCNPCLGCMKQC